MVFRGKVRMVALQVENKNRAHEVSHKRLKGSIMVPDESLVQLRNLSLVVVGLLGNSDNSNFLKTLGELLEYTEGLYEDELLGLTSLLKKKLKHELSQLKEKDFLDVLSIFNQLSRLWRMPSVTYEGLLSLVTIST